MLHHFAVAASSGVSSPASSASDAAVDERARDLDFAVQLGEREARVLEGADRLAEGVALADVVERQPSAASRGGDGRGGDRQALLGEVGDEVAKALALLAEQVLDRNAHVVEGQLGGVLGVLADLLEVAPALEALRAALDHEQADAAVALGAGRS